MKRIMILTTLAGLALSSGCVNWQTNWAGYEPSTQFNSGPPALLHNARQLAKEADSEQSLLAVLDAYDQVLEKDPHQIDALVESSYLKILLGAAYHTKTSQRRKLYREAMLRCERAMYTNAAFRQKVNADVPLWDACDVLGEREVPAMFFWVTAVLYYFKEGMSTPGKMVNYKWVQRCGKLLDHMEVLDPEWSGGGIQFSQSIRYFALPPSVGGDRQKATAYMEKAVGMAGNGWLTSRWARAKYFHVKYDDRQGFEDDLRWVVAQEDSSDVQDVFPWRIFIHRDAKEMLAHVDRYF